MKIGKVPTEILKEVIFSNIQHRRSEVLVRPSIGEDCAVVDFEEYVLVMSTDPITGAGKDIGSLAVHISCNDIASNGVAPLGIMLTILAPPNTTKKELALVMEEANRAAASVDVEIIGGHTEITDAVNRMVISSTAIGKQLKKEMTVSSGAQVGDIVLMTKHAGLEGTAIIAGDLEDRLLGKISKETLQRAQDFGKDISVVKEGVLAGRVGVTSMHDVTEGGILGALWEMAEASNLGIKIEADKIPIREETKEICHHLSIDPLRLISSGVMAMTVVPSKLALLMKTLRAEGILVTQIGTIEVGERVLLKENIREELRPPDVDELYKVI
ncbi:AIR synthase related protein domain protein [Alkaliphilus metalliredigens QYMF]|uniref:AIR synthase related protein domain protein n=1 Tax=Alkaliphilus metalliredigens (strain QYMF) TaxID=293826 RepID=A6TLV4_ALKMQ|nr:AIR synthase family protein [Alkaliphilus metalliredigens]ABR47172.1 AIR synthase related protein domain protein [Alkaliphilus metalliredigens QYMF]